MRARVRSAQCAVCSAQCAVYVCPRMVRVMMSMMWILPAWNRYVLVSVAICMLKWWMMVLLFETEPSKTTMPATLVQAANISLF